MAASESQRTSQEEAIGRLRQSSDGGGSFAGQFAATVIKNIQQKKQAPCSCCLEFSLPILFVIGTILIWTALTNTTSPDWESPSMNYSTNVAPSLFATQLNDNVCYRDADGAIDGLAACSTKSFQMRCAGKAEGLIHDGFCYNSNVTQFDARVAVFTFLTEPKKKVQTIPSIRTVVQLQWLAVALGLTRDRRRRTYQTGLGALGSSGYMYFAPASADTTALVSWLNSSEPMFQAVYGGTFATLGEAHARVTGLVSEGRNWAIVNVDAVTATKFDVRIGINASAIPLTEFILSEFYFGGPGQESNSLYLMSGFLSIQEALNRYYRTQILNVAQAPPTPALLPMPYPGYTDNVFLITTRQLIPLVIVLGFMYPVSQMTKLIVIEKELRIREAMMIMGLGSSSFYLSWFVTYGIQNVFVSLICGALLKATYLNDSSYAIIFFCFFLFSMSNISLAGVMSAFFSKSRIAALLSPVLFLMFSLPLFAASNLSPRGKRGLLILSPSAFAMGIAVLFENEITGGLGPEKLSYFRDDPNMLTILFMLGVDTIIYLLVMLYIDAVMPNDWGTPRHPLFFIIEPLRYLTQSKGRGANTNDGRDPNGAFEDILGNGEPTVRVAGLRKEFTRGTETFVAVKDLHWNLYDSQIAVLLGHNGAGKSTTINLMTGMLPIDSGDCFIYGKSVQNQLSEVRRDIGFCPQHNVLWPELTCAQHLQFYATIKGITGAAQEAAIDEMLKAVDLADKKFYPSSMLSGGQKRKLSVAIAFIGGSRLVFLDEPTAGMDVGARRHTWDLIRRMSTGRTIVLTTHFMDEADLLGHQIAIMSHGAMKCCGSSVFLKSRLGVGYNVTMSVVAHADQQLVDHLVRGFVPECSLLSSGAGEIAYRLPATAVPKFSALFAKLETEGKQVGVQAFSVSATTLEEIFLQIAHSMDDSLPVSRQNSSSLVADGNAQATAGASGVPVKGADYETEAISHGVWNVRREEDSSAIFSSQLTCMLKKRFHNARRDKRTICLQIVSPVCCILLAMLFTLINFFVQPGISLNSNMYGTTTEIALQNCDGVVFDASIPFGNGMARLTPPGLADARDMSKYLLANSRNHTLERYSAMACSDAALGTSLGLSPVTALFYNYSASHEMPISLNTYTQNYLRRAKADASVALNFVVDPMPPTSRETALTNSFKSITIGIIIMIPFAFVPSVFVSWVVKEKECKARHLQSVSGLGFAVYWISNFIFDILSFLVTELLAFVVFAIFSRTEYIGGGADVFFATFVLIFLFGLTSIALSYCLSFLFEEHATAQNTVMLGNFVCGFLLVMCVFILKVIESTKEIGDGLAWPCRVIPAYALGEGIIQLSLRQLTVDQGTWQSAWDLKVIGYDLLYMGIELPFFILFVLFWDHPRRRQGLQRQAFRQGSDPEAEAAIANEDPDVAKERAEIVDSDNNIRKKDLVLVKGLRKVYPNGKVAVKNVTFGIRPGEVFGFLGTNGAGKTTTISILCQEFLPSSGSSYICGHDIVTDSESALRCIGYCPQFDAVLDLLTVQEHLELYAGVRGIVHEDRPKIVKALSSLCELTEYMNCIACELSGGNRRKLSVALSLIGGPQVVFLDEPSAGMDPVARRGLWTAVQTVADNCAVVLTTHHLEEVEALAHRVAIMVDGTIRCIGDKTHLKNKYGSGFEMAFRIKSEQTYQSVLDFFKKSMPTAKLNEYRSLHFTYALPQDTKLSEAFGVVEAQKEALGISDYSISQTSIEQVFLRISETADEEKAENENASPRKKDKQEKM